MKRDIIELLAGAFVIALWLTLAVIAGTGLVLVTALSFRLVLQSIIANTALLAELLNACAYMGVI